jgi:ABC-type branched-subunit amino acid transport system ATPase component
MTPALEVEPEMTPALEVVDVWKSFGGVRAVQGCTFSVPPHSITGLVGPNGAGKSTAINLISGLIKPDKGIIRLNGQEIQGHSLDWTSRQGLVRTFQVAREWPALTVTENVIAAAPAERQETIWRALFARRALGRWPTGAAEAHAGGPRARGQPERRAEAPARVRPGRHGGTEDRAA